MMLIKQLMVFTFFIAMFALTIPAKANETESWFGDLTTTVQNWWTGQDSQSEVETYLDEVTLSVPPLTGEEAAAIAPAAGDYVEQGEAEINTNTATTGAPGSIQYDDTQSFNTDFSGTVGSVAAFGDATTAESLADIMPAAGEEAADTVNETINAFEDAASEAVSASETN